ncbi:Uncharacterised protein [Mycobacteroides abscessus subsp. abscessus]|nr:Uncharacterised protein [Mycobacteroides abscessus subsp. abscessus]
MMCSGLSGSGFQKHISVMWYASAITSSAKPKAWKVSTERAWMPSACPISRRPSRCSMIRTSTSGYCASCAAAIIPAGPEPTISTSVSSGSSVGRSSPCPRARWVRGSSETYPCWWKCMVDLFPWTDIIVATARRQWRAS